MPTIGAIAALNARRVPDRQALVGAAGRWTWRELDEVVARSAGVLAGLGLRPGDRLAVAAGNEPGFVIAAYAALRLGAVLVPVGPRLAVPELAYILANSGAGIVLAGDSCLDRVREAAEGRTLLGLGELLDLATDAEAVAPAAVDEGADAMILYTSGTTGRPKGVLLDHHRAIWAALSNMVACGLRDGDRYLHIAPLTHSGGIVFFTATTLMAGTHVLVEEFRPAEVLDTIERERVSVLLGVPTMFALLLRDPTLSGRDLSAWRTAFFGAAPMPERTVRELLAALPQVQLIQMCGQTEAGPTGLFSFPEQVRERPDSSGHQAEPFTEHRVVAADGADVGPGGRGELLLRGEGVMKGYWDAAKATAETLGADGWLRTGDVVAVHDDGSMRVVDRLKDVIITGGRNVYSVEVEQVVAMHPAVRECAVVGRPHADFGETIVAVVALEAGAELGLEPLRAFCAPRLADYKLPRVLDVVVQLPRNAGGKVLKTELRARVGG